MSKVAAAKRPLTVAHSARIAGNTSRYPNQITSLPMRYKSAASGSSPQTGAITSTTDVFELGVQLERQADIIQNIKNAKKDILEKQTFGRQLALNITDPNADLQSHL